MRDKVASVFHGRWARGMRLGLAAAILCGSALALSGCKMFVKEDPPPCPRVSILADAASLTRFRPGPGRDITDIELQAKVADYHGACQYDKEARRMNLVLRVGFDVQKGAALGEGKRSLRYFVSVPTFWPHEGAKKVLTTEVEFPAHQELVHVVDKDVELDFPVRNVKELERYEVFIGLQLDEAELQYNRAHGHH
jgi:hypothetical protein